MLHFTKYHVYTCIFFVCLWECKGRPTPEEVLCWWVKIDFMCSIFATHQFIDKISRGSHVFLHRYVIHHTDDVHKEHTTHAYPTKTHSCFLRPLLSAVHTDTHTGLCGDKKLLQIFLPPSIALNIKWTGGEGHHRKESHLLAGQKEMNGWGCFYTCSIGVTVCLLQYLQKMRSCLRFWTF